MKYPLSKIAVLLLCLVSAFMMQAASVHLSVSMPRGQRTIGVGELFYISYEISNSDARPATPASVPGAKVLYFERTGQSSAYTNINGVTSQVRSMTYTLTAKAQKEGSYTFGPVTVGGMKSNAVSYTIGKSSYKTSGQRGSQPSASPSPDSSKPKFIGKGDGNLFLRASVSKQTAYEQEALVYTVKLYTTYDGIKFVGATSAPKFEGFVVEESKATSAQLSYENYQGKTYATAVIARYIIFPQMKGKLKVIGNTYTVSVDQREYYHDPFWGNMSVSSPLQLNVTPNDLMIYVKGLPHPQPADFSGGVGKFTISSHLPTSSLLTNQGASIIYTVNGTGNLKYLKLPDLNSAFPSQIEVYSPETEVKTEAGASNVSGTATFDYTMIPLEEGEFKIPAVELCFFNPQTGPYERVKARGYDVKVGKGKASGKSQTRDRLRFDSRLMTVDGKLTSDHRPFIYKWGYWMVYAILTLALLAAIAAYRKRLRDLSDIQSLKSRKAAKIARRRLKKAADCIKQNDRSRFYDEMLRALWGYIAHKLKMPTSELTRDNVRERLESRNVPEDSIAKILGLLDDCEFAKYSPDNGSLSMQNLYGQATDVIFNLEDIFRHNSEESIQSDENSVSVSARLDRELSDSKTKAQNHATNREDAVIKNGKDDEK